VFSEGDPYCGIDLDGCRDPKSGKFADWARKVIAEACSYAEVSPSGTGVKIWVRGKWNASGHKREIDETAVSDKTPAIEIYDQSRYFAMTGQRLQGMREIVPAQMLLDLLASEHFPAETAQAGGNDFRSGASVMERAGKYLAKMPPSVSGSGGHNAAFNAACTMLLGFDLTEDETYSLLCDWNTSCDPPWSEKELRHKVASAAKQSGERGYLRNVKPDNWQRVKPREYKPPPEPKISTLQSAAKKYLEFLKEGKAGCIDTGIPDLDYAIGGGVQKSELVILGGRPNHGKSAIALQMCHEWTLKRPCAFLSEEMSEIMLGKRVLHYVTEIHEEHWKHLADSVDAAVDVHFRDRKPCLVLEACRTIENAERMIAQVVESSGVECVVIDYAQLLECEGDSGYDRTSKVSKTLRRLANDLDIVLLALCQMNREIEKRKKFEPMPADLKETGQLEQDADVILFGVWPHRIDSKLSPFDYQFYIRKNKNRGINANDFQCRFEPGRQMFLHKQIEMQSAAWGEINFD
jgi:replicative DNA helicase